MRENGLNTVAGSNHEYIDLITQVKSYEQELLSKEKDLSSIKQTIYCL